MRMNSFKNFIKLSSNVGYWISPDGIAYPVSKSHIDTGDELVKKYKLAEKTQAYDAYDILFENNFIRIISRQYTFSIDIENFANDKQIKTIISLIIKEHPYEVHIIPGKNKSITVDGNNMKLIEKALKGEYKPNKSKIYELVS